MKTIKKHFAICDFDGEMVFLTEMAKEGWVLEKVDSQYHFRQDRPQDLNYSADFFVHPMVPDERSVYLDSGYRLVCERKTQEGYWVYWVRRASEEKPVIHIRGRIYLLKHARDRISYFHFPILIFLALLMMYYYIRTSEWAYGLLLLALTPILVFIGIEYVKLDRAVKALEQKSLK